jgi:hypothetical protein
MPIGLKPRNPNLPRLCFYYAGFIGNSSDIVSTAYAGRKNVGDDLESLIGYYVNIIISYREKLESLLANTSRERLIEGFR